jgi:glucosamine--fructose-6-phosphate aminotransferase (isomerizing)
MCGIIGILSKKSTISDMIIESLERLSYRGYDSAGIAFIYQEKIECIKSIGDISELKKKVLDQNIKSNIGIAHTRWATHGGVTLENAHPHCTDLVAVVHNGVIENYHNIKRELELEGQKFSTDSDSELIPILITKYLKAGCEKHIAIRRALNNLEGSMAILVIFHDEPNKLFGYKKNTPLILSFNDERSILSLSSDIYSIMNINKYYININDDEMVILDLNKKFDNKQEYDANYIYDNKYQLINKKICLIDKNNNNITGKDKYEHFMLKEIYEQPVVALETINYLYDQNGDEFLFDKNILDKTKNFLKIVGCGSSYLVGTIGKLWLEEFADITVSIDIASEFRYKNEPLKIYDAFLYISQSGETADIITSANYIKNQTSKAIFSMTNNSISTLVQISDGDIFTKAGIEISVASTKTFITQMISFALLTLAIAKNKKIDLDYQKYCKDILTIPRKISNVLNNDELIEKIKFISKAISNSQSIFYIGRGVFYSIAMEGSLKLKEVSYIHAEALAGGELKHGPLALINEDTFVIALCPKNNLFDKTILNIESILARKGKVIIITDDQEIAETFEGNNCIILNIENEYDIFSSPALYTIIVQLIAYYTALIKGNEIDKPRNLAKSVTVE